MSVSPPVTWDGLNLNPLLERADGVLPVVEDVTGWYDSPDYNGNDVALVLADGAVRGPKTAAARTIVISGSALGDPAALAIFRDQLVVRAAALTSADLSIPDAAGRLMTARVRCDSDGFKHTFTGPDLFVFQITLTATDPRVYGTRLNATLTTSSPNSGWTYPNQAAWRLSGSGAAWTDTSDFTATALAFNPPAATTYQFGWYFITAAKQVLVPANAGAKIITAGDTAWLDLATDAPVTGLTVTDTKGNVWHEVFAYNGPHYCNRIWQAPNAIALGGSDYLTINATNNFTGIAVVTGWHGLGALVATGFGWGKNASQQMFTIRIPQQSAFVVEQMVRSYYAATMGVVGWNNYSTFGYAPTGVVINGAYGSGTAATWPLPQTVRVYPRKYGLASLPNEATLTNLGNAPAPVIATYTGDLSASRLTDNATGNTIYLAPVANGAQISVDTSRLNAWAAGGASRASYIGAGSVPLLIPPLSSATWTLYAAGAGSVLLEWRPAWQ